MQGEDARARADLMRDPDAKATMLEIVQKYEAMADRAARDRGFSLTLTCIMSFLSIGRSG